jgi:hypothetical protein
MNLKNNGLKSLKVKAKPIVRWGRKATGLMKMEIAGLP